MMALITIPISISTLVIASYDFLKRGQLVSQWKFVTLLTFMFLTDLMTVLYFFKGSGAIYTLWGWFKFEIAFNLSLMKILPTILFVHRYYESVTGFIGDKSWVTEWAIPITLYLSEAFYLGIFIWKIPVSAFYTYWLLHPAAN